MTLLKLNQIANIFFKYAKSKFKTEIVPFHAEGNYVEDPKNHPNIIYLDFCKTFDNVDNSILLNKLSNFGVSGKLLW